MPRPTLTPSRACGRRTIPILTPYVFPMFDYNYVGEPGSYGGKFSFDANTWSVFRREGTRDQRVYSRAGWSLPYTASTGEIYTLSANVQGYLYNISDIGPAIESNRADRRRRSGPRFPASEPRMALPVRQSRRNVPHHCRADHLVHRGPQCRNAKPVSQRRQPQRRFRRHKPVPAQSLLRHRSPEGGQRVVYGLNTNISRITGGRATAFLGQELSLQRRVEFFHRARASTTNVPTSSAA